MEKDKEGVGGKELTGTGSRLPVRVIGGIEKTSSSSTYISISKSMSSSTTLSSSSTTTRSRSTRSSSRSKNSVANNQTGSHTLDAVEMHSRATTDSANVSGGDWEFLQQKEANLADQQISECPEIISDSDEEDDTATVTNESFISAKTNATKFSASAVSAISRASQKSITVLTNACRSAASLLTNNNNHQAATSEVLYPPPARSTRSSILRKSALNTLEEEFRAKSRASATKSSSTNYQYDKYDSDDGEDFGEDVLVEEEETRASSFYKRVSKVLKFSWRVLINVTCVPIYWLLVQLFVLEKWLLYRSPAPFPPPVLPRKSSVTRNLAGNHNYNGVGVPHHDCRPVTATAAAATTYSFFAIARQKTRRWARDFGWIFWILLALTLFGLGCTCIMWSDKDSMKNTWQCLRNCILPKPDSEKSHSN